MAEDQTSPFFKRSPRPPASAPPSFLEHISKFASSPRSSPSRQPTPAPPLSIPISPVSSSKPTVAPQRRSTPSRSCKSVQTPPRRDGTSPHFPRFSGKRQASEEVKDSVVEGKARRKASGDEEELEVTPKKKKKKSSRPYADPSQYAELGEHPLTDYWTKGHGRLNLLLCGINPGIMSAQKGQHYASPTNHFWKALAGSGLTDRLLHPSEGSTLPEKYGIGSTNLVPRPSAEMSELSNEEMKACVPALLRKLVENQPKMVAFVGMKICEIVFRHLHNLPSPTDSSTPSKKITKKRKPAMPKVTLGLQPVTISLPIEDETKQENHEAKGKRRKILFWCVPSTSARVVAYQLVDKIRIFGELKRDVDLLKNDSLDLRKDTIDYRAEELFVEPEVVEEDKPKFEEEEGKNWTVTLIDKIDSKQDTGVEIGGEKADDSLIGANTNGFDIEARNAVKEEVE